MPCMSSSWAGPTSSSAPKRRPRERNIVGVIGKVGLEAGKKVISSRRRLRELIAYFGGKVVHPVLGLPGGVSKALKAEDLPKFKQLAQDGLEFALWTLDVFKKIVLANPDYVKMITSDAYTHKTCYMGMVDEQNKVNFYDGKLRVVDCNGKEVCKFSPQQYLDYVAEHVEPWSYMKFTYLKPRGWKGFVEGPDTSIYSVAPLARLNASDGMATPKAQAAYEEFYKTLGGKPVHHTLANHWARVIEMVYAAERMVQLVNDPEITSPEVRRVPTNVPKVGMGVVEAPRGTLFHHYETDERGLIKMANLVVATANNAARIAMSVESARQGPDQRRPRHRGPAQQGRDGLPRLRPLPGLRHPFAPGPSAAARQHLRPPAEPGPPARPGVNRAASNLRTSGFGLLSAFGLRPSDLRHEPSRSRTDTRPGNRAFPTAASPPPRPGQRHPHRRRHRPARRARAPAPNWPATPPLMSAKPPRWAWPCSTSSPATARWSSWTPFRPARRPRASSMSSTPPP